MVSGIIRYNNNKPVKKENPYNVFVRKYSEVYEPDWELDNVSIAPEMDIEYARVEVRFWGEEGVWNLTDMAHICYMDYSMN